MKKCLQKKWQSAAPMLLQASFWFPDAASRNAGSVDQLFYTILAISLVFFVLIVALMGVFVVAYRRRPGVNAQKTFEHSRALELSWTLIPTILVVFIFYSGVSGYIDARTPGKIAYEVQVTGQKWKWLFNYPNGYIDTQELHVPLGEPVRLVMRSEDVIHSLFIPAFRMKIDVVPGRYSTMWFTPTQLGTFPIFCAEYCGDNHSGMLARVVVDTVEATNRWINEAAAKNQNRDPVEIGKDVYNRWGCAQCHSLDGSKGIAPSFKGIWGEHQKLADGSDVLVDENYIHESIIEPMAKIVAGYAPVMPTFKGKIKDYEISGIIAYIKTLK